MRRFATLPIALAIFFVNTQPGQAQGHGLRAKIAELFIFGPGEDPLFLAGSADPGNPVSIQAHGSHFVPSAVSSNGSVIGVLTQAISGNVSNAPTGATSGGETFKFEAGVPVKTSSSAGPIFAERAQTLGRGRLLVGVGRTGFHFTSLRGISLNNLEVFFTHQNVNFAGCDSIYGGPCSKMGIPNLENDVIQDRLAIDVNVDVTSFYVTYGLTDKFDMSLVVPLVSARMHGRSDALIFPFGGPTAAHFFAGTTTNPVLTATREVDGSAFGLGDVAVRAKFNVRESSRASFALLADARFATGDEDDLLGSGKLEARAMAVFSAGIGPVAGHVNLGYLYHQGGLQNDAVLATAGFDHLIADRLTLAVDVVGELQVGRSKLQLPPAVPYDVPFKRSIVPVPIPDMRDDIVNGSFGFKYAPSSRLSLIANALVALNQGGLRSNLAYTLGLEFTP